jgi:hypothetical protein
MEGKTRQGGTGRVGQLVRGVVMTVALGAVALPALRSPLMAQGLDEYDYTNLGLRGATGEVFLVFPRGVKETIGFGARADWGFLGPHVRMQSRLAYWASDMKQDEVDKFNRRMEALVEDQNPGTEVVIDLGTIRRSAFILGGDLHWMPNVRDIVRPYLGVGADLYLLNGSGDAINGTFIEDGMDLFTAGLSGVAGLEFGLTNTLAFYADVRGALVADVRSIAFTVGFGYIREP